jgi:gamma-glutamylcyclotransferase (GGCT)/AIG2-like uncharacterized protein YtfP
VLHYFAYGSNMSRIQMAERCPGATLRVAGALHGYRIAFTRHSERRRGGVADVVRSAESSVWGLVFVVDEAHRDALDRHEGHPHDYQRIAVTVATQEGPIDAFSYEVVTKVDFVPPTEDYVALMLQAAGEHAFPDPYVGGLHALVRAGAR